MITTLLSQSLAALRANTNVVTDLTNALSLLHRSGILNFLQQRTVVSAAQDLDNINSLASMASWKAGYAECLHDLVLFNERYIIPTQITLPVRDYGGTDAAVALGNLTKEEANVIKSGRLADLESKYRNTSKTKPTG